MRNVLYVARHLASILLLPATVVILVPSWIVAGGGASAPDGFPIGVLRIVVALALAAAGLTLMARTIALFATVGRGTLAPWDPPRRLVLRGVYRNVRNPMISGVFALLLAESVFFASPALFGWFLAFVTANLVYIPLVEEPMLERRFGEDYDRYRENVPRWIPRWIPRWTPWSGS